MGVGAGLLSLWLSDAVLAGRMAFNAGDCTSVLIPFATGGVAAGFAAGVLVGGIELDPLNGLAAGTGTGVSFFPEDDGRDASLPLWMLSRTCCCWRCSASL